MSCLLPDTWCNLGALFPQISSLFGPKHTQQTNIALSVVCFDPRLHKHFLSIWLLLLSGVTYNNFKEVHIFIFISLLLINFHIFECKADGKK